MTVPVLNAAREVEAIVTGRGLLDVTAQAVSYSDVEALVMERRPALVVCTRQQRRVWREELLSFEYHAPVPRDLASVGGVRLLAVTRPGNTTAMIQEVLHP